MAVRVAIQGEPGAFSHQAALALFGPDLTLVPQPTFSALFAVMGQGAADRALLPIENTLVGSIHENFDRLLASSLYVVGETQLRIEHCLIARPGVGIEALRRVRSHPVALGQCRDFLARHPALEVMPAYDTAGAVKELMVEGGGQQAAIASELAAATYGGAVLAFGIEDDPQNFTRFLVLGRDPAPPEGASKTTLVFGLAHQPGSLHRALGVFATRGLDLAKIESRPKPGSPWEYLFYLDVLGDAKGAVADALAALQSLTRDLRVLGSYSEGIR
ncbi:MAG TPA: prephenate dehydratase [Vicinamibacteria bacterium]|nr:prephenate dehydratase [Vicinamibacteria bacterium]